MKTLRSATRTEPRFKTAGGSEGKNFVLRFPRQRVVQKINTFCSEERSADNGALNSPNTSSDLLRFATHPA
ncbi:hypothetical protein RRG08_060722 [Elysia crispata]|uniref:Uncharacterized protein n=1 Tax=Elysia crispata TaxID=231223 RepID=A0AAE0XND8_9GAST|nr:hypothetical protein RRG08_060722 [Elysia crispata]